VSLLPKKNNVTWFIWSLAGVGDFVSLDPAVQGWWSCLNNHKENKNTEPYDAIL
jgi:hypothetical protein